MAAPVLLSSDPVAGSTDNQINKAVTLTFTEAVLSSTVTVNTFLLTNIAYSESIDVAVSVDPTNSARVVLTPLRTLRENSTYRVMIIGSVDAVTTYLRSADNTPLVNSIVFEFSVGTGVYQVDSTLQKETQNVTLEGELFLPTNVKALGIDFTVASTTPPNHAHGIHPDLLTNNTIRFTFTKDLLSGQSLNSMVQVDAYPLLDDPTYLASGTSMNLDGSITVPGYYVTGSGPNLDVVFSGQLPKNLGVHIELQNNLLSAAGDTYGGGLEYRVNTQLFPEALGVHSVRVEIGPGADKVFDDYIGSLLFKNSIQLWENNSRAVNLAALSWPMRSWILYSSALDVLSDKDYLKFLESGTANSWGDRQIRIDSLIGRVAMKVSDLTRKRDVAFETIHKGWSIKSAIRSMTASKEFMQDRLWMSTDKRYVAPRSKYQSIVGNPFGRVESSPFSLYYYYQNSDYWYL